MDAKGQSIVEVILLLPFLFLFVTVLFKLNIVAQMSINNAQYARSQLFSLTGNSPEYPRIGFRLRDNMFKKQNQDLMILGVSDPTAIRAAEYAADEGVSKIDPIPQTEKLDKKGTNIKGSQDAGEQTKRNEIRVRNTASICTQINNVPQLGTTRWPFGQTVCQYGSGYWIGDAP